MAGGQVQQHGGVPAKRSTSTQRKGTKSNQLTSSSESTVIENGQRPIDLRHMWTHKTYNSIMKNARSQATSSGNDDDAVPDTMPTIATCTQVPIPFTTQGLCTYGYQQVLANRIDERLLGERQKFDIKDYNPTFIHDIMMLPGSLAELLGKECTLSVVNKMTPALLPGVQAQVAADTLLPSLVHSSDPQAYLQGVLVFGLGKEARKIIHRHYRHYRANAKRTRVRVEVDLRSPNHTLHRRVIEARAWLCNSNRTKYDVVEGATWTLEKYLEGKLEPRQTLLRISPSLRGDEDDDGYIGRDVQERVIEEGKKEIVYGSGGGLAYERAKTFTGW